MKQIQTEVLVIGGGATGTGVVRDLAMRGFKTILVEKRDLSHGTTGRYHGLLHSGGRYVVKDPQAAKECYRENQILRHIMPHCLEDTGGYFVITPWDDPKYASKFEAGCHIAGIPFDEVPISRMLREEPQLNPTITHCFHVPDASADSFLASELNAESAREHGAQILTYHPLLHLIMDGSSNRVVGALCHDLVKDEDLQITADLVVNAAGAWCGNVASTVGIIVQIRPGKGTMVAINHRIVNKVINRCKLPSDGDILVPAHTVAVIGTTDEQVPDPDHFAIEPWEINLMLEEGEKLVPGLKNMRILRAWAGVRPLYQETRDTSSRDISRAFVLLDHERRDGISGFVTITSGKWTTYRMMAESTVDLICAKLNTGFRVCWTKHEPLPGKENHKYHHLGARLGAIERQKSYGNLVCECELATRSDIERAITIGGAMTLDDIRRDVRLGMGPCQGGFCTYRAAGILHELHSRRKNIVLNDENAVIDPSVHQSETNPINTNQALRDFLQERWKGLLPILWGQQLRQERLDELIYLSILNIDHLPGPKTSPLSPELYKPGSVESKLDDGITCVDLHPIISQSINSSEIPFLNRSTDPDVLIIGAGFAGLMTAWQIAMKGKRVHLITKGWGATHWHSGCVDVLGYYPTQQHDPIDNLSDSIQKLIEERPYHPYALMGLNKISDALKAFQSLCASAGYPLHGSLEHNWLLPSAVGAIRPTCLAPETMIAGDLNSHEPILIVGFNKFQDFYPAMIADNLTAQNVPSRGIVLDLPILQSHRYIYPAILAGLFESAEFRHEVIQAIKPVMGQAKRIGFPAVLGIDHSLEVKADLEKQLSCPIFEIQAIPPSIPGIRLHNLLCAAIQKYGGKIFNGMQVQSAESINTQITCILSEAAARQKRHRARNYVLATGGILGGGVLADANGHVRESIFGIDVDAPSNRLHWLDGDFLSPSGHPIFRSGLEVDRSFRPTENNGRVIYDNLYIAGNTFANSDSITERSLEGVALATGYTVAAIIAGEQ